jgi:hypothetical protein
MNHPECIARWAAESITEKYKRGQKEHGGSVNHKNVVSHLAEEVFDSVVYLAVIQEQFALMQEIAEIALLRGEDPYMRAIHNVLTKGNENGTQEEELEGDAQTKHFASYYNKQISERLYEWLTK